MKLSKRLTYIFFPARCAVCDKVLLPGNDICPDCRKLILHYPMKNGQCDVCGLPKDKCSCRTRLLYDKLTTPLIYDGDAKKALHRLKFRSRTDLAAPIGAMMATALAERGILPKTDVITYVPMHRKAQSKRGYNQAEMLAREIGRLTDIPTQTLLYKITATPQQHSLGLVRRKGNVTGVFDPLPEAVSAIEGKRILVVDDILTTGSTMNEAAKTLLIFGAEEVNAAAAAQGIYRKKANRKKTASRKR